MKTIATIVLLILAGIAKANMDRSADGKTKQRRRKAATSNLKYSRPLDPNTRRRWFYLWLYKPTFKEAFLYSTTLLIWLVDYWHKWQAIFLTSLTTAVWINIQIIPVHASESLIMFIAKRAIDFVLIWVSIHAPFHFMYHKK